MFLFYGYRAPRRRAYIYIRGSNLPPAWKEREKKRRSCRQLSANRRGSFTRFFLPPRRFILRVVAFFFANSNGENGLYEAEAIDNFPAPVSISFMPFLMSIIIGHRAIILRFCEIIVQLYLLFFSILVFSSLFWSVRVNVFFFNFNKLNIEIYIL